MASHGNPVLLGKGNVSKTYAIKEFLNRNQADFLCYEVGLDPEAQSLIEKNNIKDSRYPLLVFDDGYVLEDPDLVQVAGAIGLHSIPKEDCYASFGMPNGEYQRRTFRRDRALAYPLEIDL